MTRAERFARFFARRRHAFALAIAAITAFFAWEMRHLEVATEFLDLLPRRHPTIRSYESYRDVYGNANNVVIALVAREGDIYQRPVIEAIERATELLDHTVVAAEVNRRPASSYVSPTGAIERGVHAVVSGLDYLLRSDAPRAADTGVDHDTVSSLTHRTVRDPRVRQDGALISPPMVQALPETQAELRQLRERVRRNPAVFGVLVSQDERAALVRASFVESRLDYAALFKHLRQLEAELESAYPVEVHATGQPLLFGWTYAHATEIALICGLALALSVVLLWAYFRRALAVFLPLSGAAVNAVWGLGFAGLFGIALDPLVLVVPMLITARAVSHSVQFVERFYEEYEALGDKQEACIRSMAELLLPGTLAILTDCTGLLTLSLASIPLVQKLGWLCAFWAASIAVTEMLLNRLLILYLPAPRERTHRVPRFAAAALAAASRVVASRAGALTIVGAFAALALGAATLVGRVEVGENRPGTPLLKVDSEYNVAAREIGARFAGLDDLLVVARADRGGRIYSPDAFKLVESLQRVLELDPAAGGSLSLVDLQKQVSRTYHNNDPRWAMWSQTTAETAGLVMLMETSVPVPGLLDPYRTRDGLSLAVRIFYRDHQAATLREALARWRRFHESERLDGSLAVRLAASSPGALARALPWLALLLPAPAPHLEVRVAEAEEAARAVPVEALDGARSEDGARVLERWTGADGRAAELRRADAEPPHQLWVREAEGAWQHRPGGVWLPDGVELRLAGGTVGVLAAANEEIDHSHRRALAIALLTTFVVIVASYRSLLVGGLLLLSLSGAALAALATQALAGISVNVNTLPVQAIGVGIGVDYAIYITDRILQECARGLPRDQAIARGVRTTGLAIGFTASTLVAGIAFWIPVSSLRFAADMSLLLCVLMVVNALGAVLLVPSLLRLLPERWIERVAR